MQIIQDLNQIIKSEESVVTIGNFDGVHLGHQFILSKVLEISKNQKLISTVLTFNPNPKEFFLKTKKIKGDFRNIINLEKKSQILQKIGIAKVIVLKFDEQIAELSAKDFIQKILLEKLNMKILVVGNDFCLGKNREGNLEFLKDYAQKTKTFKIEIIEKLKIDNEIVSSSLIRDLLDKNQSEKVKKFLQKTL